MSRIWKEWKWAIIGGVGVILVALILRLYSLTRLPVFADEAIYIRWAQVMRAESTLRFLPLSDGKQPLFMWLVIPLLKVFSDPLFAGRFTSIMAGMGTLVGIFVLTYLLFKNKKVSLIASFVYALSPYTFFFDRMALVDSLLTMFGVWTLFLGVLTAKTLRLDFAILTGFTLGAAWLTKSPALFYSLLLPGVFLFLPKPRFSLVLKLTLLLLVTYGLSFVIYNILRLGPNFHLIASRNQDYIFPLNHLWLNPRDPFIFLIDRSYEWIRTMGPWPIFVLMGISLLTATRKFWKEMLVLGAWFIIPILVQSEFAKVYTARYLLFSLPYLIILAASSLLAKGRFARGFVASVLVLFIYLALRFDFLLLTDPEKANLPSSERSGYLEEWTAGTGIKEVAQYLKTQDSKLKAGGKIVVGTEGFFGTLPDGLQMYLQDAPKITVIGVGLSLNEVPLSLKESAESGNITYLVINSSRLKIKEEDYGKNNLWPILSFKKAERREKDTHEFIWNGPFDYLYLFEVKTI